MSDYHVNMNKKLTCINISMYIFIKLIEEGYDHMGRMLNIDDKHRPVINMKNEFAYSRLMMTPSKKHYAGMLMAQEGIILTGAPSKRLDMKGISLRKSSVNKEIRSYFTETLMNKILLSEEINLASIYSDFVTMSDQIENSLNNGEIKFAIPGKVNTVDHYAAPYTQMTVRGTLLWNALFPDNGINPPDKINSIKLKPIKYSDFINAVPKEYEKALKELYMINRSKGDGAKGLGDYDIDIICFPKSVKKLPDFLIPFIDIERMVKDQLTAGMEIIEPLGFKKLDVGGTNYNTNIITI